MRCQLVAHLLLGLYLVVNSGASSIAPRPLKRIHVPRHPTVRRLDKRSAHDRVSRRDSLGSADEPIHRPDQVRHDDTLLIRFRLDEAPISLVLRPTEHLIHPDARIHYSTVDPLTGQTSVRIERLVASDVRAYEGHVLREQEVSRWWAEEQAGVVRWPEEVAQRTRGWARLVLPSGESDGAWEGAFHVDGDLHTLVSLTTYQRTKHPLDPQPPSAALIKRGKPGSATLVLRNSDVDDDDDDDDVTSCGHDTLDFNVNPLLNPTLSAPQSAWQLPNYFEFAKRQNGGDVAGGSNYSTNFIGTIGNVNGCPKNRQIVFVGLAADCTYVSHYGGQSAARTALLTNLNSVSAIYQQSFNLSVGAVELNVQAAECPTTANSTTPWNVVCPEGGSSGLDLNDRLSAFSRWRGNKGGSDGAGLWHLLTNCSTGSEVGVAWLGTLCSVTANGGSGGTTSGTGVTAITRSEWQVMSHEIGHNFGAIHDCVSGCSLSGQCCPLSSSSCDSSSNYIMSPVSIKNVTNFSPCSIGNICSLMKSTTNTTCLATPGQRSVISLQQCGNGIIDPGEDCDPGSQASACCTSQCKFASGAVCDPSNAGCCTSSCQLASAGLVCRPAVDPNCDIAEVCSGTSATCPSDEYQPDGTSCGSNDLACASGICTSRDQQCQQQGSSLNLTSGCSLNTGSSCSVTCADPRNSGSCVVLDSTFIDGTPCGYAGTCSDGTCRNGPFLDAAKSWYTRNLGISIPVTVIAGLIVLALLGFCVRVMLGRRRRGRVAPSAAFYKKRSERGGSAPGGQDSQDAIIANDSRPSMADVPAAPALVLARESAPLPPSAWVPASSMRTSASDPTLNDRRHTSRSGGQVASSAGHWSRTGGSLGGTYAPPPYPPPPRHHATRSVPRASYESNSVLSAPRNTTMGNFGH